MNFTTSTITCLKEKYFCFQGRASRSEYWLFYLFTLLFTTLIQALSSISLFFIDLITSPSVTFTSVVACIFLLSILVLIIPIIAVSARRLHDTNRSGWCQLIVLIPIIGIVIYLIFTSKKGTEGRNRFGSPVI